MTQMVTSARIETVRRQLTNPDIRIALRPDFPPVAPLGYTYHLRAVLERELARHGETLSSAGQIVVAYPHKDPDLFPEHNNPAHHVSTQLVKKLQDVTTGCGVEIVRAEGLCETVHLDRSAHNHDILHALTKRQVMAFNARTQRAPLTFAESACQENGRPHFFVLVDWMVDQGTTMANLASYIEHNGGRVLLAVHGRDFSGFLVPAQSHGKGYSHVRLRDAFASAYHAPMLKTVAALLAAGAGGVAPDEALAQTEVVLNRYGHSWLALTEGETSALISRLKLQATSNLGGTPLYQRIMKLAAAPVPGPGRRKC
jgi:hypothetical protein